MKIKVSLILNFPLSKQGHDNALANGILMELFENKQTKEAMKANTHTQTKTNCEPECKQLSGIKIHR